MRRSTQSVLLLALALSVFAGPLHAESTLIESRESQYNSIYVSRNPPYVSMIFGHNRKLYTESLANTKDQLELPVHYTRYMTLPFAYRSDIKNILEIGLGGGSTVWYLHKTFPDLNIQAVELDPEVVALAQKYFFVKPGKRLGIKVKDGRLFMARSKQKYDAILIDAYRGPFVPFHLLTKEFFQIAKKRLSDGGIVAQNVEPTTMLYEAALATIGSIFENVDVYPASGNYVAIAYDGPRKSDAELKTHAAAIDQAAKPRYPMSAMLRHRKTKWKFTGQILTDDFAPVEILNATQRHNLKLPR